MLEPCLIVAHITQVDRTVNAVVTGFSERRARVSVEETLGLDSSVAVTMRRPHDGHRVQILGRVVQVDPEGIWKGCPAVEVEFLQDLSEAQQSDTGTHQVADIGADEAVDNVAMGFGASTMSFFRSEVMGSNPEDDDTVVNLDDQIFPPAPAMEPPSMFGDAGLAPVAAPDTGVHDPMPEDAPPPPDVLPTSKAPAKAADPVPLPPPSIPVGIERGRGSDNSADAGDISIGGLEVGKAEESTQASGNGILPLAVRFRLGGREASGHVTNLDDYGFFIRTEAAAKKEAIIELDLPLGEDGRSVHRCTATIRWLAAERGNGPDGFYVEIMSFKNAKGRSAYQDFLKLL